MAKNTAKKYAEADAPPTKKLSAKERAKAEALARITNRRRLTQVTFSLFNCGDGITGQQHNDTDAGQDHGDPGRARSYRSCDRYGPPVLGIVRRRLQYRVVSVGF